MQTPVLLDTNILLALVGLAPAARHRRALDTLKMAAFACDAFVVTKTTRGEFGHVVRRLAPSLPGLHGERARLLRDVDAALESYGIQTVEGAPSLDPERRLAVIETLATLQPRRPIGSIRHDTDLLLTAEAMGAPILSFDRQVTKLLLVPTDVLEMPFPFDRNDLRAVSLREILDTSSPLRRVYKAAFAEVRRTGRALVQQADQLESAERNLAAMRHTHEAARADLEARLRSALAAEELLRKSARPSGRSALFWTAAEVALAAAGIPLPTTPITFLLDVIRRRRLTGNGAT